MITVAAYTQDVVASLGLLLAPSSSVMISRGRYHLFVLAPARSFKTHGRKIRVISKNLLPTHTRAMKELATNLTTAHCTQTNTTTHPRTYPHHDVLALLPLDQPPMSTTLLLASLSRVERHRLQIAISQQIAMQTHEHRDITLPLP